MATELAIQLSEQAFATLAAAAAAAGRAPAEQAAEDVERLYGARTGANIDAVAAMRAFEECFGSVNVGRPIGIDNAAIDADLGRVYDISSS